MGWSSVCRLALVVAAVARVAVAQPASPEAPPTAQYTETKERLDAEAMELLVPEPMALARAGDWPGAQQSFERLLDESGRRYGVASRRVADMITAFMLLNYLDGREVEGLGYGPRALEAVRRAWGGDTLEYALLLNDLAQMEFEHNKPAVSPRAVAQLQEAYRIRRAQLGSRHKETISTLIYLGRLQGQRTVTGGRIDRAAPAIATLRRAIVETEVNRAPDNNDNVWARAVLAQIYARNGALAQAQREYARVLKMAQAQGVEPGKYDSAFAEALQDGGFAKEADALLAPSLDALDPPAPRTVGDGELA
jgi:tetratricopeptide (TPR) repeat protein